MSRIYVISVAVIAALFELTMTCGRIAHAEPIFVVRINTELRENSVRVRIPPGVKGNSYRPETDVMRRGKGAALATLRSALASHVEALGLVEGSNAYSINSVSLGTGLTVSPRRFHSPPIKTDVSTQPAIENSPPTTVDISGTYRVSYHGWVDQYYITKVKPEPNQSDGLETFEASEIKIILFRPRGGGLPPIELMAISGSPEEIQINWGEKEYTGDFPFGLSPRILEELDHFSGQQESGVNQKQIFLKLEFVVSKGNALPVVNAMPAAVWKKRLKNLRPAIRNCQSLW